MATSLEKISFIEFNKYPLYVDKQDMLAENPNGNKKQRYTCVYNSIVQVTLSKDEDTKYDEQMDMQDEEQM